MTKFWKTILLITSVLLFGFLAIKISYFIAETFFFDELLYKKSAMYGYQPYGLDLLNKQNNQLIEKRIKGLRQLTQAELNKDLNVLGASSEDVYKIAIIGDSFAYGTGVRQNQRFPELMEKELNKYRKTQIYVLAQPGDGMLENYVKFLLAKENINPDLFIVGMLHNDLLVDGFNEYPRQQSIYQDIRQSCSQPEFKYSWPNYQASIQELIIDGFYPSSSPEYANLCYLDKIVSDMVKSPVLFFSFHSSPDSYTPNINNEVEKKSHAIMKRYTQVIKNHQGEITYFDDSHYYKTVSQLEIHPSVETHQGYSELLIKKIIEDPQYHFLP